MGLRVLIGRLGPEPVEPTGLIARHLRVSKDLRKQGDVFKAGLLSEFKSFPAESGITGIGDDLREVLQIANGRGITAFLRLEFPAESGNFQSGCAVRM